MCDACTCLARCPARAVASPPPPTLVQNLGLAPAIDSHITRNLLHTRPPSHIQVSGLSARTEAGPGRSQAREHLGRERHEVTREDERVLERDSRK